MRGHRIWILGVILLVVAGMGVTVTRDLDERLSRLDALEAGLPAGMRSLALDLAAARAEVEELRARLADAEARGDDVRTDLRAKVDDLACEIGSQSEALLRELEAQSTELRALEVWSESVGDQFKDARAMEARLASAERWEGIEREVATTTDLMRRLQADLERVSGSLERDENSMWSELVAPSVQLAGSSTVGSGIVLRSADASSTPRRRALVLTAWHVVRDIFAESSEENPPVPVAIHEANEGIRRETATLRAHDAALDVALLELDTDVVVEHGAVLAPRERLERVRTFHEIYAVGCPLGNDPIPTRGEVSHTHHEVDGSSYWMISAPTYIGNSGGGIFDARSHQLVGIFSKIYTHGNLRPTVVPHMGLVTPIAKVYDWIEAGDFAQLVAVGDETGALTIALTAGADARVE